MQGSWVHPRTALCAKSGSGVSRIRTGGTCNGRYAPPGHIEIASNATRWLVIGFGAKGCFREASVVEKNGAAFPVSGPLAIRWSVIPWVE